MAYQVIYGASYRVNYKSSNKKTKIIKIAGACIIITGLLLIPAVRNFLVPGDTDVTKSAISNFSSNIKEGESVKEAFSSFCQEIVNGAGIS